MKKTPVFLVAALMFVANTQSRAGQVYRFFKPANATVQQVEPAPTQVTQAPEKQETLQVPKEIKPAPEKQETLPSPREKAPAPAQQQPSPERPAPHVEPVDGSAACGADCHGHHLSCAQIKAWLCFRPNRDLCPACCSKFQPCCTPELYTYFLCRYGPNAPCCPGGAAGCAGGAPACGATAAGHASCATECSAGPSCGESSCCSGRAQKLMSLFHGSSYCPADTCDHEPATAVVTWEEQIKPAK